MTRLDKPEPGYTGECRTYTGGYQVRTRIYGAVHSRGGAGWAVKQKWDVYRNDVLLVEATSLRLAELYIEFLLTGGTSQFRMPPQRHKW